ncbi:radical SAM protein [Clostridium paraputrificum]|uniref:radical SAM protein n=1 Tax=Clostridium paraputrificum TaxID=29363 RepID=UPI003D3362F8
MSSLVLQWHITNKCNKRCKHCYQDDYTCEEMDINQLIEIGEQYKELLDEYNKKNGMSCRGHINITGGEPFTRKDLFQLLDYFKENQNKFTFGILTNGSYLSEDIVRKLSSYNPRIVQVSLDGDKEIHDDIRGKGSYDEVMRSIRLLNKYGIKSLVSFTANNKNYNYFGKVVDSARKAGAYKVWSDRMVPIGSGEVGEVDTLSPEEVVQYINILRREKNRFINRHSKTTISTERSLQFLSGEAKGYNCNAGKGLIVILENGDIMPCRRLPIVVGNINNESLKDIYFNSPVMMELREEAYKPKGCEDCKFLKLCNGGAKCISYGVYGDYKEGDYGCILRNR